MLTRDLIVIQSCCPHCKYELEVHEVSPVSYIVVDNGHGVTACPNCGESFVYKDGELAKA